MGDALCVCFCVRCLACALTDTPWSTSRVVLPCLLTTHPIPTHPVPLRQGEGAFLRGYTGSDFIQGGRVAMGPTDDVTRDMVLGKELFLEVKRIEGVVLGLGVDTTDGLPVATYTGTDVENGVYPVAPSSSYDDESSDEEGRIRRRYHSGGSRFDVLLRDREPSHPSAGRGGASPVALPGGWHPLFMGLGGRVAPLMVRGGETDVIDLNSSSDESVLEEDEYLW